MSSYLEAKRKSASKKGAQIGREASVSVVDKLLTLQVKTKQPT